MNRKRRIAVWVGISLAAGALSVSAREVVLRPNTTTTQWRTQLRNDPIEEMHVWVRRVANNPNTYFNMRFGRNGHTFDGRRVYLKDNRSVKASWMLNGRRPEGKELIMNSYHGQVHLERVVIVYRGGRKSDHRYSRRSHDRYDDDRYYRDNRYDRREPYGRYAPYDRDRRYDRYEDHGHAWDRYGDRPWYGDCRGSRYGPQRHWR